MSTPGIIGIIVLVLAVVLAVSGHLALVPASLIAALGAAEALRG